MTEEYLNRKWAEIEARVKRFEETASPHDKMMLDCMVRDWEAKMKLKLQDGQEQSPLQGLSSQHL
jgi:hypothetical protein